MKALSFGKADLLAIADQFKNLNPKDIGAWPFAPRAVTLLVIFLAILVEFSKTFLVVDPIEKVDPGVVVI